MNKKLFDPSHLDKLNNPSRLLDIPPDLIWQKLGMKAADTVVEIGAGTGFFSIPFSKYAKQLYACDISEVMVKWMHENIRPGNPNIIVMKMKPFSVGLEDSIADLVYMISLHHELEEPVKLLQECSRLLKVKGKIFIADWKREKMEQGPPIEYRRTAGEVKDQLAASGFKNISVSEELEKHFLLIAEK